MANIVYKSAVIPTANPATVYKGDVLLNLEIDGNFKSIQDELAGIQTDKAPLASPALTGNPTAPTQTAGTNNTHIATTAYADTAVTNERTATATLTNKTITSPTISNPTITGTTTAPTVQGSTAASGSLQLTSTSNATKGAVIVGATGDDVRTNTTVNGVVYTSSSNGTLTYVSTYHYRDGGTDVKVADGGTGVSTIPLNGQLLIGNGTGYNVASITGSTGLSVTPGSGTLALANTGVTSVAGTTNRVTVNTSTGAVTFNLPQDIHSGATPSFAQVSLGGDPSSASHAATKQYVDNAILGLDVKASVKFATTAPIVTINGGAPSTLDGGNDLNIGDRILVKNQSTAAQNGIYTVTNVGTGSNGIWVRAADMDIWNEVPGSFVFVEQGAANADTGWVCTANAGGTIGTTDMPWSQFAGSGSVTAGTGITVSGNQISISAAYTGQTSITTVGTITSGTWSGSFGAVSGANLTSITGANVTGTVANATTAVNQSGGTVSATTGSFTGTVSEYGSDAGVLIQSYNTSAGNAAQFSITHSGGAVNIANARGALNIQGSLALHAGNYNSYAPSLTGGGASGTWSINVTGNAGTVAGLAVATGRNNVANQVVRTDASGYLQTGYINSSSGDENNVSNPDRVWGTNGADSYLRTYRTSSLSVAYAASAGGVAWGNVSGKPSLATPRGEGTNYIDYSRYVYNNGAYSGTGWVEPSDLGVRYAATAGSAPANGGTSSAVTINYNNDSNSTYQMLWGSGNSVYGTGGIYCNPYLDRIYATSVHASTELYTGGTVYAVGNVIAYYSDMRLKDKTGPLVNALDKVKSLEGFIYTTNELGKSLGIKEDRVQIGVSAQAVEAVVPEAVHLAPFDLNDDGTSKSGENYKTVQYERLVPLLIEAIKELNAKVEMMEQKYGKL